MTVTSKSYTLRTESGAWLGQIILTSDGLFASVTDYGNLSYAWRHYGEGDFRKFLIGLNVEYFGGKMYQGMSYMIHGKQYEKAMLFQYHADKELESAAKRALEFSQKEKHDDARRMRRLTRHAVQRNDPELERLIERVFAFIAFIAVIMILVMVKMN